jgi:hypothetical protein
MTKSESRIPLESLQPPRPTHGTVTDGSSMRFRCCFPQFQATFKANVFFLHISHYKLADRAQTNTF